MLWVPVLYICPALLKRCLRSCTIIINITNAQSIECFPFYPLIPTHSLLKYDIRVRLIIPSDIELRFHLLVHHPPQFFFSSLSFNPIEHSELPHPDPFSESCYQFYNGSKSQYHLTGGKGDIDIRVEDPTPDNLQN